MSKLHYLHASYPTTFIEHLKAMATGIEPLKDIYYLGKPCPSGHGFDGKNVRYKKNYACVICQKAAGKESPTRKARYGYAKNRDMSALKRYEQGLEDQDYDPLFD